MLIILTNSELWELIQHNAINLNYDELIIATRYLLIILTNYSWNFNKLKISYIFNILNNGYLLIINLIDRI